MTPARAHSSWVSGCGFPPPCGEGLGVGVGRSCTGDEGAGTRPLPCSGLATPHPTLPHREGGRRSAQRLRRVREIARQVLAADIAVVDRLHRAAVILLDAAALLHPGEAGARQAALDVDRRVRIGVRAGRVIDRDRRLAGGSIERDFAQRHLEVGRRVRPHVDLARAGDRAGRDLRRGKVGFGDMLVHRCTPFHSVVVPAAVICSPADNPGS